MISGSSRPLQLRMRQDLQIEKQSYLGRHYWVIKDPLGLKYYRFEEEEFALLEMIDGKSSLEDLQQQFEARFGKEWAYQITQTSRNLFIFPNLIINDIMAITIRTFFPVSPDYMEVSAWALAPSDESPEDRALRLDNFLTFLGPGGYATPDDVEALESCQLGFANREVEWSDISRGMKRAEPEVTDELQMRAFWRRWHALMLRPQTNEATIPATTVVS